MIGKNASGNPLPGLPQPAPAQEPAVDDQSALQAGQEQASPEEQRLYDDFVNTALSIIYPKGEQQGTVNPSVVTTLRGEIDPQVMAMFEMAEPPLTQSPIDLLAVSTVQLTLVVEDKAEASGQQLPDDVVMHGGVEILEALVEVAEAAGVHDYSEEDIENATYRAMDLYRISSPRVDQQALSQEFGAIAEADKSGSLSQLLPGIEARMKG